MSSTLSRLAIISASIVICAFLVPTCSGQIYPIDPTEKAIILDWLSTWKNPSLLLNIDPTSNNCSMFVRYAESEPNKRESSLGCRDNSATQRSHIIRIIFSNGGRVDGKEIAFAAIPASISQLSQLRIFRASNIGLIGSIPSSLFATPLLNSISLNGNFLYGSIPSSVEAASQLKFLDLNHNGLSGVIPDFSKISLIFLRLSNNNFGCPQPFFRPSLLTPQRYPSLPLGNCTIENNLLTTNGDDVFSICGEKMTDYVASSLCSFWPQPWPTYTLPQVPQYRIAPPTRPTTLEITGGRHVMRLDAPPYTGENALSLSYDLFSVSTYASEHASTPALHKIYPFKGYSKVEQVDSEGLIWRFSSNLTDNGSSLDTIWDWTKSSQFVKFSFELRGWTFPPGHDKILISYQSSSRLPFLDPTKPLSGGFQCRSRDLSEIFADISNQDDIYRCIGRDASLRVNAEITSIDVITLKVNTTSGNLTAYVDFPILYEKDGGDDFLNTRSVMLVLSPFGRAEAINFLDRPDHPLKTKLEEQALIDPTGRNQSVFMSLGLEMNAFRDKLFYDPTILLSIAFQTPPLAPNTAAISEPDNNTLAIAVGTTVAVVLAIAVGLGVALIVSPTFREKIRPFARRDVVQTGQKITFSDPQDPNRQSLIDNDYHEDAVPSGRWVNAQPKPAN